jgi:hypothetical protein
MLSKTKGCVSLRLSKTDYTKVNRLRGPQADTTCVTSVIKAPSPFFATDTRISTNNTTKNPCKFVNPWLE